MEFPQLDEFVVAKVKKILPFGAVLELQEYGGLEAFTHISEVSSGWIRNIREHLKEGEITVGKVTISDSIKKQIDVSLKRVSQSEKKRKLEEWQNSKRAQKLLQRALEKAGKPLKQVEGELKELEEEFGSLYGIFDFLSKNRDAVPKAKVSKALLVSLKEIAEKEIKQKVFTTRRILKLACFTPDGLSRIKKILEDVEKMGADVHYVGAPSYFIDITGADAKALEKEMQKIEGFLNENCESETMEWSLEEQKQ